ncbi:hypothetical protein F2089_21555 [Salmonella enterica]|nr:hypothetical protein [Salmonella enterica]
MTLEEIERFRSFTPSAYPLDAVPVEVFAELVKRSPQAVRDMAKDIKLPLIPWVKPGSANDPLVNKNGNPFKKRADNWVYLPAFNLAMQKAFFEIPKEQRDAWLLWLGL